MEEKSVPSNGEQKKDIKFKYFLSIGVMEEGNYVVQTNVPDKLIGYGICEMAKSGVDSHLEQLKSKIVKPRGNIIDFLRRK